MPIGVNQYQILSPEQANPLGHGYEQGVRSRFNLAQALAQEAKNPYVGPQASADVQSTLLKNIYQKLVNQYTPEDYRTQFALRGAQTTNQGANTELTKLKIRYPGLGESGIIGQLAYSSLLADHPEIGKRINQALGNNQNQQIPQMQEASPIQDQLSNLSVAPQKQNISPWQAAAEQALPFPQSQSQKPQQNLAKNIQSAMLSQEQQFNPLQILMRDINADIGGKEATANWRNAGGMGGGAGVKELNALSHEILSENPNFTSDQVLEARNAYLDGRDSLSDGTPLKPISGTVNSLVNQVYKRGTDVAQRSQERFANTLETTFKEADKVAPNAFKFAGAIGKVKGGIKALVAQRGDNDPEYRDYLIFTRQVLPAMASEILRTGGANSTDSQKALAITQADPIKWDSNPTLAMEQYQFLKGLYNNIGKTVGKGPARTHQELMNSNSNINPNSSNAHDPLGLL